MKNCASVLDLIGKTPIVSLQNYSKENNIYAKLESFNPSGSMKDRAALGMVLSAEKADVLKRGDKIIESSSGNLGLALAMIGAVKNYDIHIVVDSRTSKTNLKLLRAYGAKIEMVNEPCPKGGFQQARINRVKELLQEYPESYWPNQYDNEENPRSHYFGTASEVYAEISNVDYLIIPVSSAGLITGCGSFFNKYSPHTRIIAVDAKGSTIFGGKNHPRKMTGIGGNITPPNLKREVIDEVLYVDEDEAFSECKNIARKESLLVGPSSGATLSALKKIEDSSKVKNRNIACIFPDSGDKYLEGVLNDL